MGGVGDQKGSNELFLLSFSFFSFYIIYRILLQIGLTGYQQTYYFSLVNKTFAIGTGPEAGDFSAVLVRRTHSTHHCLSVVVKYQQG